MTSYDAKGSTELFITRDVDKTAESGERRVPLSPAAIAALDACAPDIGRIFQTFDLREPLRHACALLAKADKRRGFPLVGPYDLRHSRLTAWANAGAPLPGVQYLAGHASLATTARYVQGQREAADAVILGGILGGMKGQGAQPVRKQSTKPAKNKGAKEGT